MRPVTVILVLVLLASPAAARWGLDGNFEPNTPEDLDGYMYVDPDTDPEARPRVYFQGFATDGGDNGYGGKVNPNVVGGSRLAPQTRIEAVAYLGIWKDCNGDGYVGSALGALWEYPQALLGDSGTCPEGTPHRRTGWVAEFIDIKAWNLHTSPLWLQEPSIVIDLEARVWGDVGHPGDVRTVPCSSSLPAPRGTYERTGGILRQADCVVGGQLTGLLSLADPDGSRGLAFEDATHPERDCDHALNQPVGVLSDPDRCPDEAPGAWQVAPGEPSADVVECDGATAVPAGPAAGTYVPTGTLPPVAGLTVGSFYVGDDQGNLGYVPAPAPAVHDARGSWYETVRDEQRETLMECQDYWAPYQSWTNLDPYFTQILIDAARDRVERRATAATPSDGKRSVDLYFGHSVGAHERTHVLGLYPLTPVTGDATRGAVTKNSQASNHGWRTEGPVPTFPDYRGGILRSDLTPAGPVHVTFYAYVGARTLQLADVPAATPASYGGEACNGATTGSRDGWDCDPLNWYRPDLGGTPPPTFNLVRVGQPYQLRDVDCLDGTLAEGVPARASLVDLSGETPCAVAAQTYK